MIHEGTRMFQYKISFNITTLLKLIAVQEVLSYGVRYNRSKYNSVARTMKNLLT